MSAKFTYKLKSDAGYVATGEYTINPKQYQAAVSVLQPRYRDLPGALNYVDDGHMLHIDFERDLTDEDLVAIKLLLSKGVGLR